ncbi:MAG: hypothetical protein ACK4IY_04530, partial [Chitinophagales bacterium]
AGIILVDASGAVTIISGGVNTNAGGDSQDAITDSITAASFIVNRKDKLPLIARSVGADTYVRAVFRDRAGNTVLEINDILHKNTNVNALVESGEYNIQFYDQTGNVLNLKKQFPEYVIVK